MLLLKFGPLWTVAALVSRVAANPVPAAFSVRESFKENIVTLLSHWNEIAIGALAKSAQFISKVSSGVIGVTTCRS